MSTPARRQFLTIKQQYPDVVLLFRMGDFYETFDDDAVTISQVLGITLTSREMGRGGRIPMAGVPIHSAEGHIARLLAAGHKVAIAEQMEKPNGKDVVARQVTTLVTPGTTTEPGHLSGAANRWIVALVQDERNDHLAGIAAADVTTGEFITTTLRGTDPPDLQDRARRELLRLQPAELIVRDEDPLDALVDRGVMRSQVEQGAWRLDDAYEALCEHFGTRSLEPFGCDDQPLAYQAAGALLRYLQHTQFAALKQMTALTTYSTETFMSLDAQTRRNLELVESGSRSAGPTLFSALDETRTPLGKRLLPRWLSQPLLQRAAIEARLDGVEWLVETPLTRARLRDALRGMGDIERITTRLVNLKVGPREIVGLGNALQRLPAISVLLRLAPEIVGDLPDLSHVAAEIERGVVPDPPVNLAAGGVICAGYSAELDGLRRTLANDQQFIATLESSERAATGMRTLKVGFNRVFGYYLEVPNGQREAVPSHYIRKQTLVNAERYITPELKDAEARVLAAEERIAAAEADAWGQVLQAVNAEAAQLRNVAQTLALLDVLASLAEVAAQRGYVRPVLTDDDGLVIEAGRHPILDHELGAAFVANDTRLSDEDGRIALVTGPNMAGKSTFLRQTALIVLLAQVGSFVPARAARIGIVDRIFTRIGAQDDLASGQSTFMVEMLETAAILHHATRRSLVVLDEIGRGTSTWDGLAIATAVVEFLHSNPQLQPRTLFATHYHELTALADVLPFVRNYRVDVLEAGTEVTFLHRVVPGGADRSYGVHVAQLAGMPKQVVRRAADVLRDLESRDGGMQQQEERRAVVAAGPATPMQLTMFAPPHPVVERLRTLDINALSPLDALTLLYELAAAAKRDTL